MRDAGQAPWPRAGAFVIGLHVLLVLSYAVLAQLASAGHDMRVAAGALVALTLVMLLRPLLRGNVQAFVVLALVLPAIAWLALRGLALLPLLLVPAALIAMVGSWFARSLVAGRVPLITRIVAAMDDTPPPAMADDLRRYTRGLTLAWAVLLGTLSLLNLLMACVVVPDGLCAQLGLSPPFTITRTHWSWLAGVCNYGLIGGFFVLEYHLRKRRFPGRYASFFDFLRRMRGLGPKFWRDFLH